MTTILRNHRFSVAALLLALALIAGGCGGDDATTETTPTTAAPSTTTTPVTSTTETTTTAPTTTSTTATTTTATTTTAATTTTTDVNTLAEGSGCTPGTDQLDDGIWFGYVDVAGVSDFEFDLACWFSGDAAVRASAEDGEESPPPNDYYVRNENPALRTITTNETTEVSWLPDNGDPSTQTTISYQEWLNGRESRDTAFAPGVWVTIRGGQATFIEEQYVP